VASNTQFELELKKLIAADLERLTENIFNRGTVTDFAEFKYRVGEINTLKRIETEFCDAINTTINKRD
jgi:hypothetical protein